MSFAPNHAPAPKSTTTARPPHPRCRSLTLLNRQKSPPSFLLLLAVGLALVPHSLTESPLPEGSASPVNEAVQTADESLLRLSGLGRFAEVLELGRARLANGPRNCLLAALTAQSAPRPGRG